MHYVNLTSVEFGHSACHGQMEIHISQSILTFLLKLGRGLGKYVWEK